MKCFNFNFIVNMRFAKASGPFLATISHYLYLFSRKEGSSRFLPLFHAIISYRKHTNGVPMKKLKKIIIFAPLLVILSVSIMNMTMDKEPEGPYLPTISVNNPETQEGYLAGLPTEIQAIIVLAL